MAQKKEGDLELLMWFIEGKANDVAAHIESRREMAASLRMTTDAEERAAAATATQMTGRKHTPRFNREEQAQIQDRIAAQLQDEFTSYMAVFHELRKLRDQKAEVADV